MKQTIKQGSVDTAQLTASLSNRCMVAGVGERAVNKLSVRPTIQFQLQFKKNQHGTGQNAKLAASKQVFSSAHHMARTQSIKPF